MNGRGNFAFFDRVGDPLGVSLGENDIKLRQRAAALSRITKVGVSSNRDLGATRLRPVCERSGNSRDSSGAF